MARRIGIRGYCFRVFEKLGNTRAVPGILPGEMKKAHALLDEAIGKDPEYPLNYYNRACAFAEEGDKSKALANLDQAFQRKANILKGEQMPDPRADSSFQKYVRDPDFVSLMKKLGVQ